MAGELVIALGKEPPKPRKDEGGDEPDEYDALAKGMLRAVKDGDEEALASLLRDCGFLGADGYEDED